MLRIRTLLLLGLLLLNSGLSGGQSRDRDAERGTAHIAQTDIVKETDRVRIATVFSTDAEFDVRTSFTAFLDRDFDELAHAGLIDSGEGIVLRGDPGDDHVDDAREVAAFRALLERRGWRVRAGLLLTVLAVAGGAATVAFLLLISGSSAAPSPEPRAPRCETRLVTPRAGDPVPMTLCH